MRFLVYPHNADNNSAVQGVILTDDYSAAEILHGRHIADILADVPFLDKSVWNGKYLFVYKYDPAGTDYRHYVKVPIN